jgi:hypothetical protein
MRSLPLPFQPRFIVYTAVLLITAILLIEFLIGYTTFFVVVPLILFAALSAVGTLDLIQTRHAVLRNYPLTAHIRFILEEIRPEIRQYFWKAKRTARRSPATSAPSSTSAPSRRWTSGRSARRMTFTPAAMNGCITRSRRSPWPRSRSASPSADRIAASLIRLPCSTSRR